MTEDLFVSSTKGKQVSTRVVLRHLTDCEIELQRPDSHVLMAYSVMGLNMYRVLRISGRLAGTGLLHTP